MFNGCLGALPHCVPCCYHVKFWKGRGMGNFGRGRGGGWGMGWDGDGQVTKKKVFDPCLLCSTRRSSQQKWSGGAGGGWRCLPGHPVYRCTHKQMYTQTNRWQKYLHTYMTCMYTYMMYPVMYTSTAASSCFKQMDHVSRQIRDPPASTCLWFASRLEVVE
jgi:hypothetical protein